MADRVPPQADAPVGRRELLGRGGRLAVAGSLAASLALAARARAQQPIVLAGALGLEQQLIVTYGAAAGSGLLGRADQRLVERLGAEVRIHAVELRPAIREDAGVPPPVPAASEVTGLAGVKSGRQYLELVLGFESQVYLAYLDAVTTLTSPERIRLVAELGASSAQHLALVRGRLGSEPVPSPFETGAGA